MSNVTTAPSIADASPALAALCRRFCVRRLDLFGSAATGRFDPERSDLDFLVVFREPLRRGNYAEAYFELHAGLEALFGRRIDLVTEAGLENPYFRQRLEAEKITVFDSDEAA